MRTRLLLLAAIAICSRFLGQPACLTFAREPRVTAEPGDKDDPALGTWRFSVDVEGPLSRFSITLQPGGRTSRAGAEWSREGERLYTLSLAGGQTAKLKLDPKGQALTGRTAGGKKVAALRQASNK